MNYEKQTDFYQDGIEEVGTKQGTKNYQAGTKQQTDFYQAGIETGVKKPQHKDGMNMAQFGRHVDKTRLAYSVYTNYKEQTDFYEDGIETDFYQAETETRGKKPGRGRRSR